MGNTFGVIDANSTIGKILTFAGPACAILLYLSPMPVMKDILMYKSTRELTVAPYVAMFLKCSLWVGYGQVVSEYALFYSGIPGTFLGLLYVFLFSLYAKNSALNS